MPSFNLELNHIAVQMWHLPCVNVWQGTHAAGQTLQKFLKRHTVPGYALSNPCQYSRNATGSAFYYQSAVCGAKQEEQPLKKLPYWLAKVIGGERGLGFQRSNQNTVFVQSLIKLVANPPPR